MQLKTYNAKHLIKNIVIFTHNHCLTYIAKDKRDATFKPDYLDGLVMHVEKAKFIWMGNSLTTKFSI